MERANWRERSIGRWNSWIAMLAIAFLAIVAAVQAQAQTFTVLHTFTGNNDGGLPDSALTLDAAGNLYGVTAWGGHHGNGCTFGCGTVFKLSHAGSAWILNTLYNFHAGNDGANPTGNIRARDGSIYGVTSEGGIGTCGGRLGTCGTVFKLTPPASACRTALCPWNETVLYRFTGGFDGAAPQGNPIFDSDGNLYGTAALGGYGSGTVFKLVPSGGGWTESVLYAFAGGHDGTYPDAGVIFDHSGNLLGTTSEGGEYYWGTVFELTPSQNGWSESLIYQFNKDVSGANPVSGLMLDSAGNLYGDNFYGATGGCGTVYELVPGASWSFFNLYDFSGPGGACGPMSNLIMDAAGNIYGTTNRTGAYNQGVVFKLTPSGGGWTYTSLHDFTGGSDGAAPNTLIMDSSGNLFGETSSGAGSGCDGSGCGVIFEITP